MMIHVNDVAYFCKKKGIGSPLLLLHGFTGDHSTWIDLTKQMQSQYTVLSLDLLGHGKTDAPRDTSRYQIEKIAHDLAAILEKLEIETVHLLGYSMGGRLALTFAILYPEKVNSLILESASPGLRLKGEREQRILQDEQLIEMLEKQGIEKLVDYWQDIPLFFTQKGLSQIAQDNIRRQRLQQNPTGLSGSLRGMGTGQQPSWWSHLKDLTMPVLLVCGGYDKKFCLIAKAMSKVISHAKLVEVPNAGHAIHVEDPESFGTIVKEYLSNFERSTKNVD